MAADKIKTGNRIALRVGHVFVLRIPQVCWVGLGWVSLSRVCCTDDLTDCSV